MSAKVSETTVPAPGVSRIAGGYVIAVLIAALIFAAGDGIGRGPNHPVLQHWLMVANFGAAFALPGFLAAMVVTGITAWRNAIFFAIAGALNGLLAPYLAYSAFLGRQSWPGAHDPWLYMLSGAAGGWAFWKWTYGRRRD